MLWLLPGMPLAGAALIVAIGLIAGGVPEDDRGEALGPRGKRPSRSVKRLSPRGRPPQLRYWQPSAALWPTWISDRPRVPLAAAAAGPALITLALALTAEAAGWTARYAWSPAFALEAGLTPAAAVVAAVVPGAALPLLVYAALRAPQNALVPFIAASSGCIAAIELLAVAADWLTRLLGCELGIACAVALAIAVRRWLRLSPKAAARNLLEAGRRPQKLFERFALAKSFRLYAARAMSALTRKAANLDERIVDGPVRAAGAALQFASSKADLTEAVIDRCAQSPAHWASRAGAGLARAEAAVGHSYYTAGVLAAAAVAYTAILLLLVFST
ncbi:MAG TPA: hypothetical protein VFY39_15445 [Gammaproteobacteria bacterium]|nr:hypothetical protein [Gammaproteobacteria bacterium]